MTALTTGIQRSPAIGSTGQRWLRKTALAVLAMVMAVLGSTALVAAPAEAAAKKSKFNVPSLDVDTKGTFTWNAKSVKVNGYLRGSVSNGYRGCASVVFTGYDRHGRQVARSAQPGDNRWYCSPSWTHFKVTLKGKITKIVISLWQYNPDVGGPAELVEGATYKRP